jgi:SAM-dependent methyltransferase
VYDLENLKKPQRAALVRFWEDWQEELRKIRLLDPACGSGAFLIQAFDHFHTTYQASNDRLKELRGHESLFDLDRQILQYNLHGVDLNEEAVQICKLSLWIKTAHYGKVLSSLEHIRMGNSIVDDPRLDPKAFNWKENFPDAFAAGGFDVVVGNPPYVRQEWISPIKPYLQEHYQAYDGMADLYVYFYELGMRLLKPGGRLSFVVTNKWMRAGYGEPLRKYFAENAWVESVVNFGHAKQIFEEADVFPSIIVARKPVGAAVPGTLRVCAIPREQLRIDDLSEQIRAEGFEIPREQLGPEPWSLEPPALTDLLHKIQRTGVPLNEFLGVKLYRGILTGLNEAFLIDTPTKNALIRADQNCAEILKPFVRGQDINRWTCNWEGLWMIALKSSGDHQWPWSELAEDRAEEVFSKVFPSIHSHLSQFRAALIKRQDQGRFWWELRACAYWDEFDKPKIIYQEIQFHPCYAGDFLKMLGNNKTFFIPTNNLYLLGVLNSPLMWWHNWRFLPHMKDEALTPVAFLMESLPIAEPSQESRSAVESAVARLLEISNQSYTARRDLLDWLRLQYGIEKASQKLSDPLNLDADAFVTEVKKLRGRKNPLKVAGLKALREEHARSVEPVRRLGAEALSLERQISDLVNAAYGLTPEEVALVWKTAPPRMPLNAIVPGLAGHGHRHGVP